MAGLPYNIRVNVNVPFPARVVGAAGILVNKANGLWTVQLSYSAFAQIPVIADPANSYSLVWNALTGVYTLVPISAVSGSKSTKTIATAGPYTALPTDEVLIINQTAGAPFTVNVDWSTRTKPLRVVDGKGDALTNNITIIPAAGQTQMASVNYHYVIDGNGGSITLTPLPDGSGAY
jgi:hypothetical protein